MNENPPLFYLKDRTMKKLIYIFVAIFALNFFWEISQSFLYAPHFVGIGGLITVHLRASLGDLLIVFIILLLDSIIFKRIFSKKGLAVKRFAAIILVGFVIAVIIERYALDTGRWSYNSLMPVIPFISVGLAPILQMTLLLSLIIILSEKLKCRDK